MLLFLACWVNGQTISKPDVDAFLRREGIDGYGLGEQDRAYLLTLREQDNGMALNNIARQIGLDIASVISEIEPLMIKNGWVEISQRGRYLTTSGQALAKEVAEPAGN